MNRLLRPLAALAIPGTLAVLVTACSSWTGRIRVGRGSWSFTVPTGSPTSWTGSFASSSGSSGSSTRSVVSGDGRTCQLTLGGRGAAAGVLGVTIAFDRIHAGVGTVRVDGRSVPLREGEDEDVGTVRLRCTRVTSEDVTLVVTRR